MSSYNIAELNRALEEGSVDEQSKVMRNICPCRSHVQDMPLWRKVFQAAHEPRTRVKIPAIHAIATLLRLAKKSRQWRVVLKELSAELDAVFSDPDACKLLRQQIQHDAKATGDLTPAANCKMLRRFVELNTPSQLAAGLNKMLGLRLSEGVNPGHPGLMRLWRWHHHRITFQPERGTDPNEFLKKARQWLPEFFRDANIDREKLALSRPQPKVTTELPAQEHSKIKPHEEALGCLESSNTKRRVRGLKRLTEMKVPDLFDWCLLFMEDESRDVRVAALQGMIHCDEIDCSVLKPFVDSDDDRIRAAATAALARHDGQRTTRWVEQGLKDPSATVRLETAALMGRLDRKANRTLFEIALHDPNPCVVRFAQKSKS